MLLGGLSVRKRYHPVRWVILASHALGFESFVGAAALPALRDKSESVSVAAPARLHLGFLDMSGELGRVFGGLGLALYGVETRLTVGRAPELTAGGPSRERALRFAASVLAAYRLECGAHLEIESAIPEHAGLGSGTQLALAVSAALIRLFGREDDLGSLALIAERGARSGIGLGAFEQGGFLVDGGRAGPTKVPPIICRLCFPEAWRVILILDGERGGLSGEGERTAFEKLPPMTPGISGYLCRLVLMQVLPALVEQDLASFSRAIAAIQAVVGDYFAEFQGGRYTSPVVAQALDWFRAKGVEGVGQSSWGPTGFAVVESAAKATQLVQEASLPVSGKRLRLKVCRGRNVGAQVQVNQRARQVG